MALVAGQGIGLSKAGGIRDHTRPDYIPATHVSQSQSIELNLARVEVGKQNLQTWLRMAADIDDSGKYLSTSLCSADARLIMLGQRVRVFPPDSKSSIYRATVFKLQLNNDCVIVNAQLSAKIQSTRNYYVMEIVVPRGRFMAIPKEAIIEEGNKKIVYLQKDSGDYIPQQIQAGLKGEFYTEITEGLNEGDQVVTLGSFFIDAEYKLKLRNKPDSDHAYHHH